MQNDVRLRLYDLMTMWIQEPVAIVWALSIVFFSLRSRRSRNQINRWQTVASGIFVISCDTVSTRSVYRKEIKQEQTNAFVASNKKYNCSRLARIAGEQKI